MLENNVETFEGGDDHDGVSFSDGDFIVFHGSQCYGSDRLKMRALVF